MKIGTIIMGMCVLIVISAMPVMADPNIFINSGQDEVKYVYQGFSQNDLWTVKLYQESILKYDFSGKIDKIEQNNPWYVWLSNKSNTGQSDTAYGVKLCVVAGKYDAIATGTHEGMTISKEGGIKIFETDVCSPIIPPIPELSPFILTSAGILGLVLISRRYKK